MFLDVGNESFVYTMRAGEVNQGEGLRPSPWTPILLGGTVVPPDPSCKGVFPRTLTVGARGRLRCELPTSSFAYSHLIPAGSGAEPRLLLRRRRVEAAPGDSFGQGELVGAAIGHAVDAGGFDVREDHRVRRAGLDAQVF